MNDDWMKKATSGELLMNSIMTVVSLLMLFSAFYFFFFAEWSRAFGCMFGWVISSGVLLSSVKAIRER